MQSPWRPKRNLNERRSLPVAGKLITPLASARDFAAPEAPPNTPAAAAALNAQGRKRRERVAWRFEALPSAPRRRTSKATPRPGAIVWEKRRTRIGSPPRRVPVMAGAGAARQQRQLKLAEDLSARARWGLAASASTEWFQIENKHNLLGSDTVANGGSNEQ